MGLVPLSEGVTGYIPDGLAPFSEGVMGCSPDRVCAPLRRGTGQELPCSPSDARNNLLAS